MYAICDVIKYFILAAFLSVAPASGIWSCRSDADCSTLAGGACVGSSCACPAGQQPVQGGTRCVDAAPYLTSPCVEDFQCDRLSTGYHCRLSDSGEGSCRCQPGYHYFLGRCWSSRDFGETCSRDEECMSILNDPYNMACVDGLCGCAENYYLRQRGECRRIAHGVGDACVLDVDCQFENGACDFWEFVCYDTTNSTGVDETSVMSEPRRITRSSRQFETSCSSDVECSSSFVCSAQRHCVCPVGYYHSADGASCLAELGSPATEDTSCVGLFAQVEDGTCKCPANFYYDDNMRDCVKATTRFTDSCVSDASCLTFGSAGICGEPQEPWGTRSCECLPELAVVDMQLNMCRLFSALGEQCEVESDCLAGELQALCSPDAEGVRRCSCPEGLEQVEGLCITRGLVLGDQCQVSEECDGGELAECIQGVCSCREAYVQIGDICQPAIGGECSADEDCAIENTSCQNSTITDNQSCQCNGSFVEYNQACLPVAFGFNASCSVALQCVDALGEGSDCQENVCGCDSGYHYRNGYCWPVTGLFEACGRTGQCFLGDISDRVVCRNELCQCDFEYFYSVELETCVSSAAQLQLAAIFVLMSSVIAKIL